MLTRAAPSRIADSAQRAVEGATRVTRGGGHRKDVRVQVIIDGACRHRRSAHTRLRRRRFADRLWRRRWPARLLPLEESHSTISFCRVAVVMLSAAAAGSESPPRRDASVRGRSAWERDREDAGLALGAASPLAAMSRWRTPQLLGFLAPCTLRLACTHTRTRHDCSPPRLRFEIVSQYTTPQRRRCDICARWGPRG